MSSPNIKNQSDKTPEQIKKENIDNFKESIRKSINDKMTDFSNKLKNEKKESKNPGGVICTKIIYHTHHCNIMNESSLLIKPGEAIPFCMKNDIDDKLNVIQSNDKTFTITYIGTYKVNFTVNALENNSNLVIAVKGAKNTFIELKNTQVSNLTESTINGYFNMIVTKTNTQFSIINPFSNKSFHIIPDDTGISANITITS